MQITYKTKEIEKKYKELKILSEHLIKMGVSGEEVSKYAYRNEYGTKHIPARPFYRTALVFPEGRRAVEKRIKEEISEIMSGRKTAMQALKAIGLYCKGRVVLSIKTGDWAPNSTKTIKAKKGKDTPLLDSKKMVNSIIFEVIKKW